MLLPAVYGDNASATGFADGWKLARLPKKVSNGTA